MGVPATDSLLHSRTSRSCGAEKARQINIIIIITIHETRGKNSMSHSHQYQYEWMPNSSDAGKGDWYCADVIRSRLSHQSINNQCNKQVALWGSKLPWPKGNNLSSSLFDSCSKFLLYAIFTALNPPLCMHLLFPFGTICISKKLAQLAKKSRPVKVGWRHPKINASSLENDVKHARKGPH